MLTLVFPTARGLFPMQGAMGIYDLLASCLEEQSFTDYEVIAVDKNNTIPRPELEHAVRKTTGGVRFLRPRMTPWTLMGAFAPNAARNTALCCARGRTIVMVDDCFALSRGYLARIAERAERDEYAVSVLAQADNSVAYPERPEGPFPANAYAGGIIAFPLAAAVAINGMDERFDGASGGDIDFFARLRLHMERTGTGTFVTDPVVKVTGYGHGARTLSHPRCWRMAWHLAQRRRGLSLRGNEAWSEEELRLWATCGRELLPRVCSLTGAACDYDCPEPANMAAVRSGYESTEWFNLAEERKKKSVA